MKNGGICIICKRANTQNTSKASSFHKKFYECEKSFMFHAGESFRFSVDIETIFRTVQSGAAVPPAGTPE